ncbi:MAG: tetratricopeptide repeat protein, partial [Deltaproteobacteria bacterium]|nr:tetratricopeptide repeat protein [Deltaproteobacteria bacterium]
MTVVRILRSLAVAALAVFLSAGDALAAGEITLVQKYSCQPTVADDEESCRAVALAQIQKLLFDELGAYLAGTDALSGVPQERLSVLGAATVAVEVIEEGWVDGEPGRLYATKAWIKTDPDEAAAHILELNADAGKAAELHEIMESADAALERLTRLRKALQAGGEGAPGAINEYREAVEALKTGDWFLKGFSLHASGFYRGAIDAYCKAIESDPGSAAAYTSRGRAYRKYGNFADAIADCDRAIELNPDYAPAYL